MEKARRLAHLFGWWKRKIASNPELPAKKPVFSSGSASSPVMVVGEAPGRKETELGIPFVGRAGGFFVGVLEEVFRRPREFFYITNVVKLWPTLPTRRLKTRPPTKEEIAFFLPLLKREIEIVNPRLIICAGRVAFQAVAETRKFANGLIIEKDGRLLLSLYHPAYILRRRDRNSLTAELKRILNRLSHYSAGSPSSAGFTGPQTGQ